MASSVANGDIFDFYLDVDNDSSTGLVTSVSTGSGNEVLMEDAILANWFDLYYHTGAQNSFTSDMQTIADFYQLGTVQEAGGILKFEGKLVRSKIKYITGKGMKLAVTATKSDWSTMLGVIPDTGTPAFYLNMTD